MFENMQHFLDGSVTTALTGQPMVLPTKLLRLGLGLEPRACRFTAFGCFWLLRCCLHGVNRCLRHTTVQMHTQHTHTHTHTCHIYVYTGEFSTLSIVEDSGKKNSRSSTWTNIQISVNPAWEDHTLRTCLRPYEPRGVLSSRCAAHPP